MFEIQPSSEFSAWFESLAPSAAEEVACALDLLAVAGTALGPSHASRALLWFDGTGGGTLGGFELGRESLAEAISAGCDVQELLLWQREAVRCLESEAFRHRLALLEPTAASAALTAVDDLKRRLREARLRIGFFYSAASRPSARWVSGLGTREERRIAERLGADESPNPSLSRRLREGLFEVLRVVGLEPSRMMNSLSGLCELTIATSEPRMRVLFGLDVPGQRIVALLGEPLTRAYYGDSVKLAERRFREYCANISANTTACP